MPSRVNETSPARGFPGSSFKYTPIQHVRVLFTSFIQGLFAEAPVGSYHWVEDQNNSEIIIVGENTLNPDVLGKRPGINTTRAPMQFYSVGIDDMEHVDFRNEKKTKNILVPGTMYVNCCSRSDIESENIAWIVAEHIWLLREILLKEGFFELGRNIQIGSPSPPGSIIPGDNGEGWYLTAVSVPFQFYRQSAFTPLGKQIVSSIETRLTVESQRIHSRGAAQAGHELPLSEAHCFPSSFAPEASDTYGRTPDPAGTREVFLPKQPHPLNPAAHVTVRSVRPNQPGIRPASMNGVTLPIKDPCKGESEL